MVFPCAAGMVAGAQPPTAIAATAPATPRRNSRRGNSRVIAASIRFRICPMLRFRRPDCQAGISNSGGGRGIACDSGTRSGGSQSRGAGERFLYDHQCPPRRARDATGSFSARAPQADRRIRGGEAAPGDVPAWRVGERRGTHVICAQQHRIVSSRRDLCGQDPQGRETRQPPRPGAHQVRADHQPQDRQGPRPDDPAVAPAAGGSGDRVVDRRIFLTGLGATLTLPLPGEAQPVGKIPRVGIINLAADEPAYAAFRERLRELGWIEGRNVVLESRFVHGNADRYAAFAAELVRLNVDVIVTTGGELGARAAQRATSTLPIVVGILGPDPVAESLVTSIKSPGGNLTGFVLNSFETSRKRLEVLKDALPRLSRVGLLYDPGQASTTKGHLEAA